MGDEIKNSVAYYMAAIDGGYCALQRSNNLKVVYTSPRVGQLLHVNTINYFTDFLSDADIKTFFNAFKPAGVFSVKCNLRCGRSSFIPVTLKCNTIGDVIYCIITTQLDWYNYAANALKAKRSYDRLLEYTDSYLFETDLSWNLIAYTGKVPQIVPIEYATANLATFLTDKNYVSQECSQAVQRLLNVNTLFMTDVSEKLKIKFEDKWTWFELHIQSVVNKTTNVIDGIVGSFTNIDAYQNNLTTINRQLAKDPLTKCFTKSYLFNDKVVSTMSDSSWLLSISINNVDRFEDDYGEEARDAVIREVSEKIIKEFASAPGLVCRFGKEEFVVYLPDISGETISMKLRAYMKEINRLSLDGKYQMYTTVCAVRNNSNEKNMHGLLERVDNESNKLISTNKDACRIVG